MSSRTAIIDATNKVVGVIMADSGYTPPAGQTAIASDTANIGDTYNAGTFIPAAAETSTATQLAGYAMQKQRFIAGAGVSINVAASGQPAQMAEADTSAIGRADLTGLAQLATLNSSYTTTWVQTSGSITLTATQIMTLAQGVAAFIESTYQTLGQVLAAITAGTITTMAQVDTPPSPIPAWPVNS